LRQRKDNLQYAFILAHLVTSADLICFPPSVIRRNVEGELRSMGQDIALPDSQRTWAGHWCGPESGVKKVVAQFSVFSAQRFAPIEARIFLA
jgi:hypothetical protein